MNVLPGQARQYLVKKIHRRAAVGHFLSQYPDAKIVVSGADGQRLSAGDDVLFEVSRTFEVGRGTFPFRE